MPPFVRRVVSPSRLPHGSDHDLLLPGAAVCEYFSPGAAAAHVVVPRGEAACAWVIIESFRRLIITISGFPAILQHRHIQLIPLVYLHLSAVVHAYIHRVIVDVRAIIENIRVPRLRQVVFFARKPPTCLGISRAADGGIALVAVRGLLDPEALLVAGRPV